MEASTSQRSLSIAISAREQGFEGFILPKQNAREAAVVNNLKVYGVENIKEVIEFFNNERNLELASSIHGRNSMNTKVAFHTILLM